MCIIIFNHLQVIVINQHKVISSRMTENGIVGKEESFEKFNLINSLHRCFYRNV